ncbi:hypothetical protein QFC24_001968 [Naganishia onofrii]|uniref:Uncharacterized protein n=1 Tax=Naganishia onofrii TaxID=1851511 RepID=A0ACC2XRJ8_9TREE|nr:hypothetical protein QFC24_001968 [Naganishia onofrii]
MKAKLHTRSANATPLAFLPVAFRGLVVFPNAFLLLVVDDDSNSAIPLTESENMLVFLALFGAGGLPIPGSYGTAVEPRPARGGLPTGRAVGKSLLAMEGSSSGWDVDAGGLYSRANPVENKVLGRTLSDWENVRSGKDMSSIEGDSLVVVMAHEIAL